MFAPPAFTRNSETKKTTICQSRNKKYGNLKDVRESRISFLTTTPLFVKPLAQESDTCKGV